MTTKKINENNRKTQLKFDEYNKKNNYSSSSSSVPSKLDDSSSLSI